MPCQRMRYYRAFSQECTLSVKTKCMEFVRFEIPTEDSDMDSKLTPGDRAGDDGAGMKI